MRYKAVGVLVVVTVVWCIFRATTTSRGRSTVRAEAKVQVRVRVGIGVVSKVSWCDQGPT